MVVRLENVRFLFVSNVMLTKKQKQELIDKLGEKIKTAKAVIFADYKGLKVVQLRELRRKLKASQGELKVAKKTLIDLALQKANIKDASSKDMSGQISLVFGQKDEVSSAKILHDFSKKNEGLKILGAILEGKFLDESQAVSLAKVPAREQSLAQLAGTLNAPLQNLVSVFGGNIRGLVFVLSQIKH
jgi:large subunit ribosomal protein L10